MDTFCNIFPDAPPSHDIIRPLPLVKKNPVYPNHYSKYIKTYYILT